MTTCPTHPAIELPHMFTCPLCAQEARTAVYAKQRAESAASMPTALQPPPRPTQGDVTGLSGGEP